MNSRIWGISPEGVIISTHLSLSVMLVLSFLTRTVGPASAMEIVFSIVFFPFPDLLSYIPFIPTSYRVFVQRLVMNRMPLVLAFQILNAFIWGFALGWVCRRVRRFVGQVLRRRSPAVRPVP